MKVKMSEKQIKKSRKYCMVGDKYNKLTITKFWTEHPKKGESINKCECICECGKITTATFKSLVHNGKKSCGCGRVGLANNNNARWTGYGEISGTVYASIKSNAKKRNIQFSIKIEELWCLFIEQDRKCSISGVDIYFSKYHVARAPELNTASLDRIDSNLSYTIDNVQWVHKDVNCMKMTLPQNEFIFWCCQIAKVN